MTTLMDFKVKSPFKRTAFQTSRTLDFFTESELTRQIGYPQNLWALVLVKELVDNSLDACESADIPPNISVVLEKNNVTVQDNGPGLPAATIESSLDYMVRVSDKKHYISPTRGQLGNALKCVYATAYVATGAEGKIEIESCEVKHTIIVSTDKVLQEPKISHKTTPSVKTGTSVRLFWDGIARM
jgi:DNA topoisomerase VI subunit B